MMDAWSSVQVVGVGDGEKVLDRKMLRYRGSMVARSESGSGKGDAPLRTL